MTTASVSEVFRSVQGEGPLVGLPFVFVRFGGCNLRCKYCDTKWSRVSVPGCTIHDERNPRTVKNPLTVAQVADIIRGFPADRISFTGGEPMLSSVFIESLLPKLRGRDCLMETNGTLPGKVTLALLKSIRMWSVDIKLPGLARQDVTDETAVFLEKMRTAGSVILKAVFSKKTPLRELQMALKMAEGLYRKNRKTVLVFQPVSRGSKPRPGGLLPEILKMMEHSDMEIRLIPQVHRILGLM